MRGMLVATLVALTATATATASANDETPRPPLGANEVELRLGAGWYGRFTPPAGWSKGTGFGNEQCWNAPRAEGRICISATWKRGRDAKRILEDSLEGLSCVKSEDKEYAEGPVSAVRRECVVQVGPRREGRIWLVSAHALANDAVSVEAHLQRDDKTFVDTIFKSINEFRYFGPVAKPEPPASPVEPERHK